MSTTDHRKQSLYFPEEMLGEIELEAQRQDRSLSWIVQQAWKVARTDLRKIPSPNDVFDASNAANAAAAAAAANTPR